VAFGSPFYFWERQLLAGSIPSTVQRSLTFHG
jgi:hypothetical protein